MISVALTLRALRDHKAFASAALITLALGIGANTAIFSVVYGVLLRPLAFPDADRIVQLSEVVPGGTPALPGASWISNLSLLTWEPHRTTIGEVANMSTGTSTVGSDNPHRVRRAGVGDAFFRVLGVQPVRGRFFTAADSVTGAPPTAVITAEMWRDEFGSDENILTRTVTIDDRPHQIVGVAPPNIGVPTVDTRFWTPVALTPLTRPDSKDVRVEGTRAIARLMPGATPAQAAAEGTALARTAARPMAADMLFGKGGPVEIHVRTLSDQMTTRVRPALVVLLVAVGLLLLIACANVANLFLSRGVSRERELAVRVALGASRARLVRELLAESVVISALGGVLGVALAGAMLRALPALAPNDFPRLNAVQLDWWALAFAIAASVMSGLAAGLIPAVRGARPDLLPSLREGVGASSGRRTALVRRALLVAEASLAVMLLVGGSLLGRSFINLVRTDAGYDAANVLTARVYLPGASRGRAETDAFVNELLTRLRALPGVLSAGASNMAPLGESTYIAGVTLPIPGKAPVTARALSYVVTPGYAESLRLRVLRGRVFEDRDLATSSQLLLVNEQFVKTFLPDVEPVGLRMPVGFVTDKVNSSEIIGVVGNVLKDSLEQQAQAEVYVLAAHGATIRRELNIVLRTASDPIAYADDLRRLALEMQRDVAVDRVQPLSAQVAQSVAQPRFAMVVLLAFATLALLLASVGLYGVLSYTVARRRREIGVRTALGASRGSIVSMILREGMMVAVLGSIIGASLAAALTRLMQTLLVGIQPLDLPSFVAAIGTVLLVSLVTCGLPAREAARTDPAIALRTE